VYNSRFSESEPENQIRQFWRGGFAHVNEPHTEQCQGKFHGMLDLLHLDPIIVQITVSSLITHFHYERSYLVEFYDAFACLLVFT